jgi:8-oxo-dGTP pyrophosphatase MutT (NUDIX family)
MMVGTIAGAGALVTRQNAVLLVLRERSGKVRWELPSGLLESGESFGDAAVREALEETSLYCA